MVTENASSIFPGESGLRPQLYSPVYQPFLFGFDSDKKAELGFQFVVDVYNYNSSTSTPIERLFVPLNPAGIGVVDLSRYLTTEIDIDYAHQQLNLTQGIELKTPFENLSVEMVRRIAVKVGERYRADDNSPFVIYDGTTDSPGDPSFLMGNLWDDKGVIALPFALNSLEIAKWQKPNSYASSRNYQTVFAFDFSSYNPLDGDTLNIQYTGNRPDLTNCSAGYLFSDNDTYDPTNLYNILSYDSSGAGSISEYFTDTMIPRMLGTVVEGIYDIREDADNPGFLLFSCLSNEIKSDDDGPITWALPTYSSIDVIITCRSNQGSLNPGKVGVGNLAMPSMIPSTSNPLNYLKKGKFLTTNLKTHKVYSFDKHSLSFINWNPYMTNDYWQYPLGVRMKVETSNPALSYSYSLDLLTTLGAGPRGATYAIQTPVNSFIGQTGWGYELMALRCGPDDLKTWSLSSGLYLDIDWEKTSEIGDIYIKAIGGSSNRVTAYEFFVYAAETNTQVGYNDDERLILSDTIRFEIPQYSNPAFPRIRVSWLNQYSVPDYFNFTEYFRIDTEKDSNLLYKSPTDYSSSSGYDINTYNRGTQVYSTLKTDVFTVTTDWLNKDEANHLKSMFDSPRIIAWVGQSDDVYSVIVRNNTYSEREQTIGTEKLIQASFELELSLKSTSQVL